VFGPQGYSVMINLEIIVDSYGKRVLKDGITV
jgi:hypothetical protein